MPLTGKPKRDIPELVSTGKYPQKQAVAIALDVQRRKKGKAKK